MIDLSALRRLRRKRKHHSPVRPSRVWLGLRLVLGLGAATFVVGALWAVLTMPALSVETLQIDGCTRLSKYAVERALSSLSGRPILFVSLTEVRDALEAIPGIEQAFVARRLPDRLEIQIVERTAIARADFGGELRLVDRQGALFPAGQTQPGDDALPLLVNLATPNEERRLAAIDRPALVAIEALATINGIPEGTVVDLRSRDRLTLQGGADAPVLWLDRAQPERNLQDYFLYRNRVADLGAVSAVDLRFAHRLTVIPAEPPTEDTLAPSSDVAPPTL